MSFAMDEIRNRKTNNPANQISQAAKKAGLSYWNYMEKIQPSIVHKFVWGVKKETRKQERKENDELISAMATSNNPRLRILAQMRNLIGGRGAY
jgi:hypothetical protein